MDHKSLQPSYCTKLLAVTLALFYFATGSASARENPDQLLFGDTHLHTNISYDAYMFDNQSADADTAYRFAKGEPTIHPYHRARVQLDTPLDFLAVTDHAELLGVAYGLFTSGDPLVADTRLGRHLIELTEGGEKRRAFFLLLQSLMSSGMDVSERPERIGTLTKLRWKIEDLFTTANKMERDLRWVLSDPGIFEELVSSDAFRNHWLANAAAAERHNEPGKFTALIGWEYSPAPDNANLHRVVLMSNGEDVASQFLPFSAVDSDNPEDLWRWLGETESATGANFVAIPHNSNVSKGRMFARVTTAGDPIEEGYARQRARWEPVAEVTQIKGTSETHPLLSPDDEFANFEFFSQLLETRPNAPRTPTVTEADYVRAALKTGIEIEGEIGSNPYKLGLIGSTDGHTGLASAEEDNFMGKMARDSIPENKQQGLGRISGWEMSASGLAAVWARENTREEIVSAFKRREVYGTSGPRIAVRFFGGHGFEAGDITARDLASVGYAKGVPMGGDLAKSTAAPSFLIQAVRDPSGANLDRIQIIKGWLDEGGKAHERVFDVAWSGARVRGANGRIPPVGDTVERNTAHYENTIGAPELVTIWRDPTFNSDARAFYYVRVLQIPTPRNSLYDSVALGAPSPEGYAEVIQERAYTSPIWYTP